MKKMKKLLAAVLAGAMAVSMGACGGTGTALLPEAAQRKALRLWQVQQVQPATPLR